MLHLQQRQPDFWLRVIVVVWLVAMVAALAWPEVQRSRQAASAWMNPIVTPEEVAAIDWVRANTPPRAVFASGIFEGELLMGRALREGTVGGDWAIVPNVIERMNDVQYKIFNASSAKQAWEYSKKYNATYVWVANRQTFAGYAWAYPAPVFDDPQYFENVYDKGVRIYKVN